MTATLYASTDTSAPTLNNTAGSLSALLKACLVDGYGSMAAAGWASDYSDANYRTFRAPSGLRCYLRLYDYTASNSCAVSGYETMTSTTAGTNAFSYSGQCYFSKTSSGVARAWYVGANQTAFWYWTQYDATSNYGHGWWGYFGDLAGAATLDIYHTTLIAAGSYQADLKDVYTDTNTIDGHTCARSYGGDFIDSRVSKTADRRCGAYIGAGLIPYPHVDGYLWLSPIRIFRPEETLTERACIRGNLQGVHAPMHTKPVTHGDTFTGVTGSPYDGKSFLALNINSIGGRQQLIVETSNTW